MTQKTTYGNLAREYGILARKIVRSLGDKKRQDHGWVLESLVKIELNHIQTLERLTPREADRLREYQRLCRDVYKDKVQMEWIRLER